MKNDLWYWMDWNIPSNRRVAVVDEVWSAVKVVGDPKGAPTEMMLMIFRSALGIPRRVPGAEEVRPTREWVGELYAEWIKWVRENRQDLIPPPTAPKAKKKPEMARA